MGLEVVPSEIDPGAAFIVRVKGAAARPTGSAAGMALMFSPCGTGCYEAIGAVDKATAPALEEVAVRVGSSTYAAALRVRQKTFAVQHLSLPDDKVTPSPQDEARANREAALLKTLWARHATPRLWQGNFLMPLANARSTEFGVERFMNGIKKNYHTGIDIEGSMGETIRAANSGRVALAQDLFYGGMTLVLDHGEGIYTLYMHTSRFLVALGDTVQKGQAIAEVGSTGRSTGPHLHFGVKVRALNTDPVSITALPITN